MWEGGVSRDAGSDFGLAGEIYAAPADTVTGRVGVTYSWRWWLESA